MQKVVRSQVKWYVLCEGPGCPGEAGAQQEALGSRRQWRLCRGWRELCWGVWGLSAMRGEGSHKETGAQRRGAGSENGGFVWRLGVFGEQRLEEGTGAQGWDQGLNGEQGLWEGDRAV